MEISKNKTERLRKNLSQIAAFKSKETRNTREWDRLERKYDNREILKVVIGEQEQKMATIATTVRRYLGRMNGFRPNRMFQNNYRQCYRELNQDWEGCGDKKLDAEKQFKKIWGSICQ